MAKPLIGITGRQYPYSMVEGCPPLLADSIVDAVLADYVTAIIRSGGLPVHIPMDVDPAEIVTRLDGVVLTGGADVDPAHYGQEPHPSVGSLQPERDGFELAVAAAAIDQSAPTLGVCRGIQVLNVAAGGTLKQDVPAHARYDSPPKDLVHDLVVAPDTLMYELFGEQHRVNSFHHQVVDRPGTDFIATAHSDDGEIEAIELAGKPVLGIQWHPEMLQERDPLFDWLVSSASAR